MLDFAWVETAPSKHSIKIGKTLKLHYFYSMILLSAGFGAWADETQSMLARQIEEASVTSNQTNVDTGADSNVGSGAGWTLYPPLNSLISRREMEVNGCDVTARTVYIHDQNPLEKPSIEITFDLARTRLPDASVPIGNEFGFSHGTVMFALYFVPPYEPMIWSVTKGVEFEQPVSFTRFLMEPVADETQPRRLLALLNQYQNEYCRFSG